MSENPKPDLSKLSRGDLIAVISHLQQVIGAAHGAAMDDRNPNRAAHVSALLTHGHDLCIAVRSTEPPSFGSRSRFTKIAMPRLQGVS